MKQNTSSITRLQALPPIFRGADLTIRFQWTSKTASQYLYLWKQRGLVRGLGGRSDVYANLLTSPHPNWERAVIAAMPTAVTIGIEALRQAGWTTQVPQRPTITVDARQPNFSVTPFDIIPRETKWFKHVRDGIEGDRSVCLPVLRPAWALADMLRDAPWGTCGLWPDDVEWDLVEEQDELDWKSACTAFGLQLPALRDLAESSR